MRKFLRFSYIYFVLVFLFIGYDVFIGFYYSTKYILIFLFIISATIYNLLKKKVI